MTDLEFSVFAGVLLFLMLEPERQMFMLFMVFCGIVAGSAGAGVGLVGWVIFAFVRFVFDLLGWGRAIREAEL